MEIYIYIPLILYFFLFSSTLYIAVESVAHDCGSSKRPRKQSKKVWLSGIIGLIIMHHIHFYTEVIKKSRPSTANTQAAASGESITTLAILPKGFSSNIIIEHLRQDCK